MKRMSLARGVRWSGFGALAVLLAACKSSSGTEAASVTNTTSADVEMDAGALQTERAPQPRAVPWAGNPASAATIFDGQEPGVTEMSSSSKLTGTGNELVTPQLVTPAPLVTPGLENSGTTSPYSPQWQSPTQSSPQYSPAQSSRISMPSPPLPNASTQSTSAADPRIAPLP